MPAPSPRLRHDTVGLTLYQWATSVGPDDAMPTWVRDDATRLPPDGYATRRLFAAYLGWAFTTLTERLDGRVNVKYLPGKVAAAQRGDGEQVLTLEDGRLVTADIVLCLPGHTNVTLTR